MSTQFYMQNNFTHGELDPRLFSGTNLDYYYKSLKRCRNLYVRPQGGIKKRHGLAYEDTLTGISSGEFKLGSFIFSDDERFLLVFVNLAIQTYQLNADGSLGTRRDIVTTYTTAQLPDLQFAQNGNLMVITHPAVTPRMITWDDATSAWNAIADLPIKNYPAYDFEKNYYTYTFQLNNAGVGTSRTLTSSVAVFEDDHVGGIFISLGGDVTAPIGLARIKSLVGAPRPATQAVVDVIFPFDPTVASAPVPGTECFLGEIAFSTNRGFPQSVTFYEDRLAFGGTPKLPQTLFMSRIGTFNDFNQGDSSDDDAIIFTLSASEYNEIKYLVSDKSLQIFCSESEFSSMQYFAEPLTPATASFRKQSAYGTGSTRPVILDNQTFFVRVGGSSVMSFIFDANSNSYSSQNASIFSAHLINNPVSGAVLKGDQLEDADYMFMVNGDGTLLVYQTLQQQNVSAWTLCATGQDMSNLENLVPNEGKFLQVQEVKDTVFAAVERKINGVTVIYLERFEFDYKTDSSVTKTYGVATNVVTGLSHLIDQKNVRVIGDGAVLSVDQDVNGGKVTTSGTLTLKSTAKVFDVGLNYDVLAETVPVNIVGSGRLYIPKKIVRCFIDYYESIGIKVNEEFIPELVFGTNTLDEIAQPKTGVFTTYGDSWDVRATIRITQNDPLPFLVIGLGFEVSI